MSAGHARVRRAGLGDLSALGRLFDAYRRFYDQPSDEEGALRFLRERMINEDSLIWLAEVGGKPAGFTQVYPGVSSVRMAPQWLLNDLYVAEDARGMGAGEALLGAVRDAAQAAGAAQLKLETALNNHTAQRLYERAGWVRDTAFCTYTLQTRADKP